MGGGPWTAGNPTKWAIGDPPVPRPLGFLLGFWGKEELWLGCPVLVVDEQIPRVGNRGRNKEERQLSSAGSRGIAVRVVNRRDLKDGRGCQGSNGTAVGCDSVT